MDLDTAMSGGEKVSWADQVDADDELEDDADTPAKLPVHERLSERRGESESDRITRLIDTPLDTHIKQHRGTRGGRGRRGKRTSESTTGDKDIKDAKKRISSARKRAASAPRRSSTRRDKTTPTPGRSKRSSRISVRLHGAVARGKRPQPYRRVTLAPASKKRSTRTQIKTEKKEETKTTRSDAKTTIPAFRMDDADVKILCDDLDLDSAGRHDAVSICESWISHPRTIMYVASDIVKCPVFCTIVNSSYQSNYRSNTFTRWVEEISSTYAGTMEGLDESERQPGTATLTQAVTKDDNDVITIFSRRYQGMPSAPDDTVEQRQKWFSIGLSQLATKYPQHTLLVFPYAVGNPEGKFPSEVRQRMWIAFQQSLYNFALYNYNVRVIIFTGTPEGGTHDFQQDVAKQPSHMLFTKCVKTDMDVDQAIMTPAAEAMLAPNCMDAYTVRETIRDRIRMRFSSTS